jgi:hypothetical protein
MPKKTKNPFAEKRKPEEPLFKKIVKTAANLHKSRSHAALLKPNSIQLTSQFINTLKLYEK